MKHSLILLVGHEIKQIYDPIGDREMILEGLELAVRYCTQLHDMLQEEDQSLYLLWLAQVRNPELVTGMKRLAHRHRARLLMLEIVSEQDTSKHAGMWVEMRSIFMTEVATQRSRNSPAISSSSYH